MNVSNVFYCPGVSEMCILNEEETTHAIRVLRLKNGSHIFLIDGNGGFFRGEIADANPKKCAVKILHSISKIQHPPFNIHLAVAPTKNISRYEWFLEKAAEIGVSEITPLICEHSERKILKTERLEKILISAIKQSLNLFLPKLNMPENFSDFITHDFSGQKFIAHYSENHLKNFYRKGDGALILIGPEGDFSEEEIKLAKENGYAEVSLGKNRLRTETAAIAACHTINLLNEN